MTHRLTRLASVAGFVTLILALMGVSTSAEEPNPGAKSDPNALPAAEDTEVLAKGPVHEAFATTAEAAGPASVVPKQPPEPRDELPPDQKPEGDNVQWIPGYWDWDEEGDRFRWVSGCWRNTPPGRIWVPGSWRDVPGGWQWVFGFWQESSAEQTQQSELVYLSKPPDTGPAELAPSTPQPGENYFCSPGSWVWRGKYVWRPGVWIEHRPDWVWTPARYYWTPLGYVFVDGYWDYLLASRGVLFAPVVFTRPVAVYTPKYVISELCLVGALFVRRGCPHYHFGDYFDEKHVKNGFRPWAGRVVGTKFTFGSGPGRGWVYDPLWTHYEQARRDDRDWRARVNDLYVGRYTGSVARPPVSLTQQNAVINKLTNGTAANATNSATVEKKAVLVNKQNVTDVAMIAPLTIAKLLQPEARIKPLTPEARKADGQAAQEIVQVALQRAKLETAAVARLPAPQPGAPPVAQPQTLKLEVSKAAVTHAQVKDEKKLPPPVYKADVKIDPKLTTKTDTKVDPKVDPKVTTKTDTKVDPKKDASTDTKSTGDPKKESPTKGDPPQKDPPKKAPPRKDPPKKNPPKNAAAALLAPSSKERG